MVYSGQQHEWSRSTRYSVVHERFRVSLARNIPPHAGDALLRRQKNPFPAGDHLISELNYLDVIGFGLPETPTHQDTEIAYSSAPTIVARSLLSRIFGTCYTEATTSNTISLHCRKRKAKRKPQERPTTTRFLPSEQRLTEETLAELDSSSIRQYNT
ncbi:unnamed protein product [Nippostrongylus brasiliensis]|uniref:Uncharacterized protein n=1 Tax=Nippostrongylus brasiliensis TaxID=27835 RepID=A0A0N4Y1H3_NIPBR|nr:unnamed protein product [Nippostrongylus brasiliensis]